MTSLEEIHALLAPALLAWDKKRGDESQMIFGHGRTNLKYRLSGADDEVVLATDEECKALDRMDMYRIAFERAKGFWERPSLTKAGS